MQLAIVFIQPFQTHVVLVRLSARPQANTSTCVYPGLLIQSAQQTTTICSIPYARRVPHNGCQINLGQP